VLTVVTDAEPTPAGTTSEAVQADTTGGSLIEEIVRDGARRMLAAALEAGVAAYIAVHADQLDERGRRLVVRNGRAEPRQVLTSAGAVEVVAPRVNDMRVDEATGERRRFASAILPAWCRKSPKVTEVLPLLYLHGLSSKDFVPALESFLGTGSGLSAAVVTRLTTQWQDEARASWADLLRDCKRRGMRAPVLAVGDGALGFWAALREVFPETREQRCWFHKIANGLSALPKSAHPGAKKALAEIWNAEDREHARRAVAAFKLAYGAKFGKAVDKITNDLDELLAFYDFPAEHWIHLRTTNPIWVNRPTGTRLADTVRASDGRQRSGFILNLDAACGGDHDGRGRVPGRLVSVGRFVARRCGGQRLPGASTVPPVLGGDGPRVCVRRGVSGPVPAGADAGARGRGAHRCLRLG
jgi:hypothetical protein